MGTLGKQGREGPRAQILKRRSQKEGALAVSHRLAHNDTGVWVCERETVQARMGVCVCDCRRACVLGRGSVPGCESGAYRWKQGPLAGVLRIEAETHSQRQMLKNLMIYIKF